MKRFLNILLIAVTPLGLFAQSKIDISTRTKNNLPAARVSGQLTAANLPATAVQTNQPNTYTTGLQDYSAVTFKPPVTTVLNLPSAAVSQFQLYAVRNGATASDCTVGGGSFLVECVSDGVNWIAWSGGAGGSGSSAFNAITTGTNTAATMTLGSGSTLNASVSGSEVVDFSNVSPILFKIPVANAAAPVSNGQLATDSATGYLKFGSAGVTVAVAAWAGDLSGGTPLAPQVTVTHLLSPLTIAQGGTGVADFSFSGNTHKSGTVSGVFTSGDCLKIDASNNIIDNGGPCNASVGSVALSAITPATASNSINNGDFAQQFNASLTTANKTFFKISENIASVATGTPVLFGVSSLSGSTASPVQFDSNGNGVRLNTAGLLSAIGTGGINATQCSGVSCATGSGLTSGQLLVGAGASAIGVSNLSGDVTTAGSTATVVGKVNGVSYGTNPTTNTVPVVTSSNNITYEGVPNAALANSSITFTTASPLAGGVTAPLGSVVNLTCPSCNNGGVSSKAANYTLLGTDAGTTIIFNGSSLTATLPNPAPSATWTATVFNLNSSALTVSRNALTVNAATNNISLPQYQAVTIRSDGTNYFTDTVPLIASTGLTLTPAPNGLTLALVSPVSIGTGGTGASTQQGALNNLMPVPTRPGDVLFWNGSNWIALAGNNVGTQFLQETSAGVPSWGSGTSSIAWSAISAPSSNLILGMGLNTTTFNTTAATNNFFEWANNTAATLGTAQSSPLLSLCGQGWEGGTAANVQDCWQIQAVIPNGSNPNVTLAFTNTGSSSGIKAIAAPGFQSTGTSQGLVALTASATPQASLPTSSFGLLAPASITTSWFFQPSGAVGPAASGPMLVGAVASNISALSYGTNSGNTTTYTTASGTLTSGHLTDWDASGNAVDSGIVAANVITDGSNLTNHGVALGSGSKTIGSTAVGGANTVLLGNAAADPTFGAVPNAALVNSSVTFNGQGISLGSTGNVNQGAATNSLAVNKGSGAAISGADIQNASASLINSSVSSTQAVTYAGGQDASANSALGNVIIRGANQTGAGGAASQGGDVLIGGGSNAATNIASQGGSVQIIPGLSTGASTQGLQGLLVTIIPYIKGATATQWNLQCESASMTVADCGITPANWLGVAELVNTNTVQMAAPPSQVPINASAAVTLGHTVCAGGTSGKVTDSGGVGTCANAAGPTVGVVVATSGTWNLPDGTSFTASTTLPLVQMNTAAQINTAGGGSGTVASSVVGTIPVYTAATTVTGNGNLNFSGSTLTIGVAGSTTGQVNLTGSTSGAVSIIPQAAAGTYNFNLPVSSGSAGQPLLSGGGGTTAMSFGALNLAGGGTIITGILPAGNVASIPLNQVISPSGPVATFLNGNNPLVFNWAQTTVSQSGITFGETTAATGAGDIAVNIQTLNTSTAAPLQVTAQGTANGVQVDPTGKLSAIGTGHVNADQCNGGTCGVTTGTLTNGDISSFNASNQIIDSGIAVANVPTMASAAAGSGNIIQSAGANKTQVDSGISVANVPTMPANGGAGDLVGTSAASKVLSDSGILIANVVTAAANYTSGNLVQAAASNKTTSDSGIPTGNVVTAASNAAAAKQISVSAGANKALSYIDFPDSKSVPFCINLNGTPGTGVTTTTAITCTSRAGTNNKDAFLGPFTSSDTATFKVHIPKDWDTGTAPSLSVDLASTDATAGHTVILQAATECSKLDGTTTDDVAFNTAQSLSTVTLVATANQSWTATLGSLTTTGCSASGIMWVKLTRTTDTATNVELYQANVTIPRLLTVQAN